VTDEGLVVTLEREFPGEMSLRETHEAMTDLERELKVRVPLPTCAERSAQENEMRRGMKQKLLEDKIVVVTGASRGIGKGIATQLGKYGATPVDDPDSRRSNRDHHTKRKKSYAKFENSKGQSPTELAGVSANEVVRTMCPRRSRRPYARLRLAGADGDSPPK
jgi:hypothetical protein